jgi:sugar phosphate isomerase/epimerase
MPHTLALFTGPWTDLPLNELAQQANEWGYQALDLACWGKHFEVQRALAEADYCRQVLDILEKNELRLVALSNHPVGQAITDHLTDWHQETLPEYVWGDGDRNGVASRAAQEMIDTAKAAHQIGVSLVVGHIGSPLASYLFAECLQPQAPALSSHIEKGWKQFANAWKPTLDAMNKLGVAFATEVGPGQAAFDLYSSEAALLALEGHDAFGFAFNPAHLHWQGVDASEFLRTHFQHIWHVVVQDVAMSLSGRSGLLGSLLPSTDHRRGCSYRAPGQGNVDWPNLLRTLHQIGYEGALTVSIKDADMDRDFAAAEAVSFLRRLDFEPAAREQGLFI